MKIFRFFSIFIILIIAGLFSLSGAVIADHEIYSTTFKDASSWKTNSETSFYLDATNESYHYLIEGGSGSYSSLELKDPVTGPFSLEFDVIPKSTDEKSSFRFGIGNNEMDSQKGPLILAELNNQNGDKVFALTVISKENLISRTYSMPGKENYSGKTVKFEDGIRYHIKLTWYPDDKRVSMTVTNPDDQSLIFSHYVIVSGKIEELSHLFLTSFGEGQSGSRAEGYIDNITLTALDSIPDSTGSSVTTIPTPSSVPTIVESTATPEPEEADLPVATPMKTPFPMPPSPTPTQKSGLIPITVIGAVIGIFLISRRN
jgi:hypothetical protein